MKKIVSKKIAGFLIGWGIFASAVFAASETSSFGGDTSLVGTSPGGASLIDTPLTTFSQTSSLSLCGGEIEKYAGEENAKKLVGEGKILLVHPMGENKLTLLPDCQYSPAIKTNLVEKVEDQVPFTAEFLYLIPKSKLLEGSTKSEITKNDLSVVLRSISKMEGMRYHFAEKKNGDVLYKASYMVDGKNSKNKIADVVSGSADGLVLYCYQKDNTYGDIFYELKYHQAENILHVAFENTNPMSMMGIKAVAEGNLHINVLSIDCGDDLLLYISTDVSAKKIPLFNMRKKMEESMCERMDSIYRWFLVQFK